MMLPMLIVNTQLSYPDIGAELGLDDSAALVELAEITRKTWPPLTDAYLKRSADFLAGTAYGKVTVTYRITGWARTSGDKIEFQVVPAPELTKLIGIIQPGGPWVRGEARGTRQVSTPRLQQISEADRQRAIDDEWTPAVIDAARRILGDALVATTDQPDAAIRTEVYPQVKVTASGRVIVTVSAGQEVLVRVAHP